MDCKRPMGRGKEFLAWYQMNTRLMAKFSPPDEAENTIGSSESAKNFDETLSAMVQPRSLEIYGAETVELNKKPEKSLNDFNKSKLFHRDNVAPEIMDQIRSLPINAKRNELINLIRNNQIVIVVAETGSGKSTQIPQYIVDAGLIKDDCMIGITQPRRVAAKSLAERVALECGVELGTSVGYAVRFDNCMSPKTIIKYMTDGLLVKDYTQDEKKPDSYSVIMIDEAHERSVHTDVAFGLLKRAAKKCPDLKIIISSATLEVEKFFRFFNDAPVFSITGRGYDVELIYEPSCDYLKDVFKTIVKIHESSGEAKGDILAFLTGQSDIEVLQKHLEEFCIRQHNLPLIIIPCHGTLPFEDQQKIFAINPPGCRKVILATNIAETSITIDGIVSVVDCGYVKEKLFNHVTKIEVLKKVRITKFQAIQRQGRAGRTQPGKCYRLYSEKLFNDFKDAQKPDIQRSNIDGVILDLIAMGVENPKEFEFVDAPADEVIDEALTSLIELSALDASFNLIPLGRQMAAFPLEPSLAKVLITSAQLGCSLEILKIVAIVSIQHHNLFLRNGRSFDEFRKTKEVFDQPEGDHLTFLNIYDQWTKNECSEEWCRENFIQYRHLVEAKDVKEQLKDIMIKNELLTMDGQDIVACQPSQLKKNICRAFTSGYFFQLGLKNEKGYSYRKLSPSGEDKNIFVHPTSALFQKKALPEWIIFQDVLNTSRAYVSGVAVTDPQWILEYAPEFWKKIQDKYATHSII